MKKIEPCPVMESLRSLRPKLSKEDAIILDATMSIIVQLTLKAAGVT